MRVVAAWILFGAVLVSAWPAAAATLRVPSEYATINAGVDAAAVGDTVLVAPGTYSEYETRQLQAGGLFTASAIVFLKVGVTVVSEGGSGATTLDMAGQGDGDVIVAVLVEAQVGGPLEMAGFRITGVPSGNSGMFCRDSDPLVLRDCVFDTLDGTAGGRPGGLYAIFTDPVSLYDCRFVDCRGGQGPSLFGGLYARNSSVLAVDCTFERCSGGALYGGSGSFGPSAVFRRCRFVDNVGRNGGGLAANGPQVTIEDCWFEGNSAPGWGAGAVAVTNVAQLLVRDSVFLNNRAVVAAGLVMTNSVGTVRDNTFHGNVDDLQSGGAHLYSLGGNGPITIHNNIFSGARGSHAVDVPFGAVVSSCNVFWDNPLGDADDQYPWGITDTIQDPLFCDPDSGDLSLSASSPCLPANSGGCGLIGALPEGCGAVSVEPRTWARTKSLYR